MGKLFERSGICYHRQKNAFRAHEIVTVESFTKIWSRGRFHVSKSRHLFAGSDPERKPFTWLRAELFVFQKLNGAIPYPYDCDYWTYLRWFFFPACKAFAVMMPLSIYPCPLWHSVLAHHTHNLFIIKYENILISTTGNWHTITRHTFIVNISEGGGTFRSRKNIFCGSHGIASPLKHSAHSLLQECTVDMKAKLFRLGGNGKLAQNVPSILSATVVLIIIIWKPIDH